jgi:UDP-N-acetylglucosamine 2-epimerase (non-hydrolysing)/GDP/UDP-N,N'-diacetylbacillosamine 2-epimerase (hydrolysing)
MNACVLTTGRQDWGILRSTCLALRSDPRFVLRLLVGGMHCAERFGRTARLVAEDDFAASERLDWMGAGAPLAAEQAGEAVKQVARALARERPDFLLLAGDRFETAAAALAATLARVPLVHLHGGEETEGSFDNALRHAITKLSHLHLTSHPAHARRVIALGEDPATVHVVGAPGLDNLHRADLPGRAELERDLGLPLAPPVVVVTLHPATLGGDPAVEAAAVAAAMDRVPATYVITLPNTDPGHEVVRTTLLAAAERPGRRAVEALGERRFWGLLRIAGAMLGNSSSALIEAPLLRLPAVNVGARQKGRVRAANVIDSAAEPEAIALALTRALASAFRASLAASESPFGDGHAAERILKVLGSWRPPDPPVKAMVRVE